MNRTDPEREAVIAAAERAWTDVVDNYEAGRETFIAARVSDHERWKRIAAAADLTLCAEDCPTGPHAHPFPYDDELTEIARRVQ